LGVPEAERANWQTISADVELEMQSRFDSMPDELNATLDYESVANEIKALAAARPRKLLETLAAEMITALLRHPTVASAGVELRKRILPGVDHVAVRMKRGRG
ncbi:MAG: dihydroneopterin aldolase, partial [Verrucomicrobia bacterium]|nr:dihydroneopterin aldolase [Verrucomicrobiota bacterium]